MKNIKHTLSYLSMEDLQLNQLKEFKTKLALVRGEQTADMLLLWQTLFWILRAHEIQKIL